MPSKRIARARVNITLNRKALVKFVKEYVLLKKNYIHLVNLQRIKNMRIMLLKNAMEVLKANSHHSGEPSA